MKLNVKRTILIGLSFMTIMLLWQVYNWYLPLFLKESLETLFKGDEIVIGIVMGLDNLVALFMIPLTSKLSDKCNSKLGKRMPFIITGILLSALTFILLPFINKLGKIWLLLIDVVLVLISMNIYRSPCVSLMPDITPKQLRNRANSIINILGGAGVATGYILIFLFYDKTIPLTDFKNFIPFLGVTVIMLAILVILLLKVKENKFLEEYKLVLKENNLDLDDDQKEDEVVGGRVTTNKRNIILSLLVVFLVYMASNAVETWLSLYAKELFPATVNILGLTITADSLPMAFFGVGTFTLAIPAALIADKLGRKKAILLGTIILFFVYISIGIIGLISGFSIAILPIFLIGGAGFALVTINIYPLVVENCSSEHIGLYTGRYYTSSMLAQTLTPALCGLFVSKLVFGTMKVLFIYCSIFALAATITLLFIKEDKKTS